MEPASVESKTNVSFCTVRCRIKSKSCVTLLSKGEFSYMLPMLLILGQPRSWLLVRKTDTNSENCAVRDEGSPH